MNARRHSDDDAIAPQDILKLLRVSKDAVLIGGQALAFWISWFGIELPPGPRTFVSNDADFLGFESHVGIFSDALGGRAEYPSKRQLTALHGAVIRQTRHGEHIGVDVLRSVVGLDAAAVRKRAVNITDPADPGLGFKVMHPIDCMISRFENLRKLAEKQNSVGIWQAKISIAVCRAYVKKLLSLDDERGAIEAATRILEVAGTAPGLQAFRKYDLDLLDGIPLDGYSSRSFRDKQYARTAARIRKLRESYRPPPSSKA